MTSPSDRITTTEYPALPSLCRICNRGPNGRLKFIDFELSFDYDGAINFCEDCMLNIAQTLGFLSHEEAERLGVETNALKVELDLVRRNNEQLQSTLDSILNYAGVDTYHRVSVNVDADEDSTTISDSADFAIVPGTDDDSDTATGESEPSKGNAKSKSSGRSKSVPSDGSESGTSAPDGASVSTED